MVKTALFLLLAANCRSAAQKPAAFDLVVYGATAAGVSTSVAAAREGLHVALVDPGHHPGGLVSGGLSSSDHGKIEVIGGISREFFERVGKHYGEPIEWNFEPHVAEQVFVDLMKEAGVTTFYGERLKEKNGVRKRGASIVAITTENGRVFVGKIFADCSYEGDLMGQAGVSYTWGRESTSVYGESLAGVRGRQRPDHHFNVRVSPFASDGSLLPEVQKGPKGEMGSGDKKVQAYTYRMCLTNDPANLIPFEKPSHYDARRYELLARLIEALTTAKGRPPVMKEVMIVSTLKGRKFDINSFGGFSIDHIGANWDFPTATYARRGEIWQDHLEYEAGFFYFLTHDPRVPAKLRDEIGSYGLAKDEFTDNHNWPFQLYIRESRRMVGEYVMTQKDIQDDIVKPDSIGMGSYQSDSHHVERIATADGAVENEGEMYVPTKPYQIPFRMVLPRASEAANLLVPVCFSASHVAYSTLRMEPQYMIIGQAAGTAAAMAVKSNKSVHEIAAGLGEKLASQGAVLKLLQK